MPDIPIPERTTALGLWSLAANTELQNNWRFESQITLLFQWTHTVKRLCRQLAARRERWNAWPFPLRLNHPSTMASQERSRERGSSLEKKQEKWTTQCPPYVIQPIVRDTNLSSDASAGELCMLIFIDLAHLFMRQRHCLSTHTPLN